MQCEKRRCPQNQRGQEAGLQRPADLLEDPRRHAVEAESRRYLGRCRQVRWLGWPRAPEQKIECERETGWQLSHGEKSRVYLARALLQRSRVLVLDETFGALDPASLRQSMDFVLDQAEALVVISHR
jgi:ABC-type glutathione transport system ATPase component